MGAVLWSWQLCLMPCHIWMASSIIVRGRIRSQSYVYNFPYDYKCRRSPGSWNQAPPIPASWKLSAQWTCAVPELGLTIRWLWIPTLGLQWSQMETPVWSRGWNWQSNDCQCQPRTIQDPAGDSMVVPVLGGAVSQVLHAASIRLHDREPCHTFNFRCNRNQLYSYYTYVGE